MPAALKWFVDGAVAWYASKDLKRNAPEKVKAFSRRYFEEQDRLAGFLREECTLAPALVQPTRDVVEAFKQWAVRTGEESVAVSQLPALMRAKGFGKKVVRGVWGQLNCYVGLALKEDLYTL